MCMWLTASSMWRNDASSGLIRSITTSDRSPGAYRRRSAPSRALLAAFAVKVRFAGFGGVRSRQAGPKEGPMKAHERRSGARRRTGRRGRRRPQGSADGSTSLAPAVLAYAVGPLALVVLLVFRHFGLVARTGVGVRRRARRFGCRQPDRGAVAVLAARVAPAPRPRRRARDGGHVGHLPQRVGTGARDGVHVLGARRHGAVGCQGVARRARMVGRRLRGRSDAWSGRDGRPRS